MQLAIPALALALACPAAGQTWYRGNLHTALGQATLDGSTPGVLHVQNLGPSGQDGVSIALGSAQGVELGRRFEPVADVTGTTYVTSLASGAQPAGGHSWSRAGAGYDLSFDFGHLGATSFDLELRDGGATVQVFPAVPSGGATLIPAGPTDVTVRARAAEHRLRFAAQVTVDVPGSGSAVGDELVARPAGGATSTAVLTRADLVAAGTPAFTLFDEALVLWGAPFSGLGDAHMDKGAAELTLSNIGAGGLDGVRVGLDAATLATLALSPLELAGGQTLRAAPRGDELEAGWARLERAGGVLQLAGDFSASGASEIDVAVADYDVILHSALLPSGGPLVTIAPGASAQPPRVHRVWTFPSSWSTVVFEFDSHVAITFPGGPTVQGPELHVTAYQPTSPTVAPFELDLTASGLPALTIERAFGFMNGFPICWPAAQHSGGDFARLSAFTTLAEDAPLHLEVEAGPPGEFGYFLVSESFQHPGIPVSNGFLCLASPIARYSPQAGSSWNSVGQFEAGGVLVNAAGTSSWSTGFDVPTELPPPIGGVLTSGNSYYFQCWFRDGTRSNFSSGLIVLF